MDLRVSVDYALRTVGPPVMQIYKRVKAASTGSGLLGLYPATVPQPTDTLLVPQPMPTQLGEKASVLSTSNLVLQSSDYQVDLSATSITIDELENPLLTFVMKSGSLVEEYRMLGYNPYQFQGLYVAFKVYLRRATTT